MSTNKERLIAALQEPLETTLTRYKTHLDGLKEDQVEENRDLYGENVITKGQEDSIIKKIYESIINPFTVILLVIALVSFITNVWLAKPGEEDPTTSIIIVTLVLISGGIRFIQELRSDKAASNLSRMIVNTATVLRDGSEQEIPIDEIVVGDVVKLSAGDMIPADVVLLDSRDFFVQQSGLTGESDAVEKACLAKADGQNLESLLESESLAFMGTNVISGRATALVLVVGDETMMGAIEQTINTYDEPTSFEREMNSISWLLIRLMLVMVPVVFVINGLTDGDWLEAGVFALSVGVGLTPEMLPMIITASLAKGSIIMAKEKVVIKKLNAIQDLGAIDILCTDKTGTLTEGKPVVTDVIGDEREVLSLAASLEDVSQHPLAQAIVNRASELGISLYPVENFQALHGKGVTWIINGKQVLLGNAKLLAYLAIPHDYQERFDLLEKEAKTVVFLSVDGQLKGLIALQDVPKENAREAIAKLKKRGLRTVMLTGDNAGVAHAIAEQIGIEEVIANVLPEEKAHEIHKLQKNGKLAFVGDGINDAPALSVADVGIAMGSGTDIAIESADLVLTTNNLLGLARAFDMSKKTFNRILLNLFWASIYNLIGIPIAAGVFSGLGLVLNPELAGLAMAFSSVSVLISSLMLNFTKVD